MQGIDSVRALSLIQEHGTLEEVLASLDLDKACMPDPYPYEDARRLFTSTPAHRVARCSKALHVGRERQLGEAANGHCGKLLRCASLSTGTYWCATSSLCGDM